MYLGPNNEDLCANDVKYNYDYLHYKKIPFSFYRGVENRLTRSHLMSLAAEAETIAEPNLYGKFIDEEHYLKTLRLVLNSTHETRNRIIFFLQEIIPKLQKKEAFLDVGPGDGTLTAKLSKYFHHLTVVDNNKEILDSLISSLSIKITYEKISSSILDAQLASQAYDLVVLSHMLYYIAPSRWLDVIDSTYEHLKPGGLLVIVLGGDELGKADLIRNFGGITLPINKLSLNCINKFGQNNVHLYSSKEAFLSSTRQAMLHISAFMLCDANIIASKDALTDYIDNNIKCSENYFKMTTIQKYIVIRKNISLY